MSPAVDLPASLSIPVTSDISRLTELIRQDALTAQLCEALAATDFRTAYDFLRSVALQSDRLEMLTEMDRIFSAAESDGPTADIHNALLRVITSLHVAAGDYDSAMASAARALGLMAQSPKRKDEPFLSVLASLLYDIALIHYARSEFRQAERDIEKAVKIFGRLFKNGSDCYESARISAVNAATQITRSREKQIEMLAAFHETVNDSLRSAGAAGDEALAALADSLAKEGETLVKMGRHREGIQYYSRALRYLTRIEPEFSPRQLELSVALGEALLLSSQTREKGIHLLNTMLHKATRLRLPDQHRRIVDILVNARERSLDILGIWHKLFPR